MGCDIHTYIEYKWPGCTDPWAFGDGGIHIMRNYPLFAHLAGVRDHDGFFPVLVPPRGIPEDPSWEVRKAFFMAVSDTGDGNGEEYVCTERHAAEYVRYGSSYWAHERHAWAKTQLERGYRYVSNPDWHTPSWLTLAECTQVYNAYLAVRIPWMEHAVMDEPKYPSGTRDKFSMGRPRYWRELATDEERLKYRGRYLITIGDPEPLEPSAEFEACIAAMAALDQHGAQTRLVFWFDN